VDNSVPIPASSQKARVNLSQHIIRHPGNPYGLLTEDPLRAFKQYNHLQGNKAHPGPVSITDVDFALSVEDEVCLSIFLKML
jgi:hypothetical protein